MIGRLTQFWGLVRELDLGRVRAEIEQPPRLAFHGAEGSGRHTLARSLLGPALAELGPLFLPEPPGGPNVDASLLVVDGRQPPGISARHAAQDLAERGLLLVVLTHADEVADADVREERLVAATVGAGARGVWVDARDAGAVEQIVGPALLEVAPGVSLG